MATARTDRGETISNAIGLAKSAIGDCADQIPYQLISAKLWDLVKMLYRIHEALTIEAKYGKLGEKP